MTGEWTMRSLDTFRQVNFENELSGIVLSAKIRIDTYDKDGEVTKTFHSTSRNPYDNDYGAREIANLEKSSDPKCNRIEADKPISCWSWNIVEVEIIGF